MSTDPAVLTVEEVASILRVSPWTVYARIKDGTLPCVAVGRLKRVPRDGLDAFLAGSPGVVTSETTAAPPAPDPARRKATRAL